MSRSEFVDQKYRPLKKMLKKTVKSIANSAAHQQLPPASVMDNFMARIKVMVSYPGFGDDHYSTFMAACHALYKAYQEKDLALFVAHFGVVGALKKKCHHRYK